MSVAKFKFKVNGPQQTVWDVFFRDISAWWPKDGLTSEKTIHFVLEEKIGGKMFEDFGGGQGLIWADVIGIDRPHSLMLKGQLAPAFGGPAISFLNIKFKSEEGQTSIEISDSFMGPNAEKNALSVQGGWEMIFGKAFKSHFESLKHE